jgi:hypothetical protein
MRLSVAGRAGAEGSYGGFIDAFRVLCAVREGDWGANGINQSIERALVQDDMLSRQGEWYEGRSVLVTRNDAALSVFNGDIGIALRAATRGAPMRAYFADGDLLRSVAVSRLARVETAFAMAVHKSKGSEFATPCWCCRERQAGCSRGSWSTPASRGRGPPSRWSRTAAMRCRTSCASRRAGPAGWSSASHTKSAIAEEPTGP